MKKQCQFGIEMFLFILAVNDIIDVKGKVHLIFINFLTNWFLYLNYVQDLKLKIMKKYTIIRKNFEFNRNIKAIVSSESLGVFVQDFKLP